MAEQDNVAAPPPKHKPRPWRHHRLTSGDTQKPIAPGRTTVYASSDPKSGVVVETEEEYKDHLNRGYKDTCAPEAWA